MGQDMPEVPEPSPICQSCQRTAVLSEEELDAELARLKDILQDAMDMKRNLEKMLQILEAKAKAPVISTLVDLVKWCADMGIAK